MRIILLFYFLLFIKLDFYSQIKQPSEYTMGYRTGISYYSSPYYSTYKRIYQNEKYLVKSFTGFYNQIFINKTIGKSKRTILEFSIGFNNYRELINFTNYHVYFFNRHIDFRQKIFTPTFYYRYQFLKSKNWEQYIGAFIAPHIVFDKIYVRDTGANNNLIEESRDQLLYRWTHVGVNYFGLANINQRWSFQYSLSYSVHNNKYEFTFLPGGITSYEKTQHRLNANIGLGYRL